METKRVYGRRPVGERFTRHSRGSAVEEAEETDVIDEEPEGLVIAPPEKENTNINDFIPPEPEELSEKVEAQLDALESEEPEAEMLTEDVTVGDDTVVSMETEDAEPTEDTDTNAEAEESAENTEDAGDSADSEAEETTEDVNEDEAGESTEYEEDDLTEDIMDDDEEDE